MTLHAYLLAALTALVHVFDEHPLTREEWLVRYWDASSGHECHLLSVAGCLEGDEPTCPRDLRTKWGGPDHSGCLHDHETDGSARADDGKPGGRECRECVDMAIELHERPKGAPPNPYKSNADALWRMCGIPCTPRLDRF